MLDLRQQKFGGTFLFAPRYLDRDRVSLHYVMGSQNYGKPPRGQVQRAPRVDCRLPGWHPKFVWVDARKWLAAAIAISLGWVAVTVFPQLVDGIGWDGTMLILSGGLCYTVVGLVYALRRSDPLPAVFGYHEIFHALVVAAVALQYSVVAFWLVHPL
jgi:Haemolysin-III related